MLLKNYQHFFYKHSTIKNDIRLTYGIFNTSLSELKNNTKTKYQTYRLAQ